MQIIRFIWFSKAIAGFPNRKKRARGKKHHAETERRRDCEIVWKSERDDKARTKLTKSIKFKSLSLTHSLYFYLVPFQIAFGAKCIFTDVSPSKENLIFCSIFHGIEWDAIVHVLDFTFTFHVFDFHVCYVRLKIWLTQILPNIFLYETDKLPTFYSILLRTTTNNM